MATLQLDHVARIELPDLPEDVVLLILQYLQIWDLVRCQFVSRLWSQAFSKETFLKAVLKRYPGAYEVRAHAAQDISHHHHHHHGNGNGNGNQDGNTTINTDSIQRTSLLALTRSVASRYYHLSHGKVKRLSRFQLFAAEQVGHYYPVGQWEHHESQPSGRLYYQNAAPHLGGMQTKPYLFLPTLWTYDDGLIVFAPVTSTSTTANGDRNEDTCMLSLLDLSTYQQTPVPFSVLGRVIRNIRLADRTLIIEWAERTPFHSLNDVEQVHRHFVTCFDVKFSPQLSTWSVEFRSEFKIHSLGLPLNSRDRFFSAHNAKHFVVYFFQPNRSMYTGAEMPIESLFVWDISAPSPYLPSTDPSGRNRPPPRFAPSDNDNEEKKDGPTIIARFPFNRLDELGVRQHGQIKLMCLGIDSDGGHVIWRENICEDEYGYFDPAHRTWKANTTIIPFISHGPHQYIPRDGSLPPYRGHASMDSCDIEEDAINNCFIPIMDVLHRASDVRFSLVETCFTGLAAQKRRLVRIKVPCGSRGHLSQTTDHNSRRGGEYITMQDDAVVREVTAMGRIAGDERYLIGMNGNMELIVCHF